MTPEQQHHIEKAHLALPLDCRHAAASEEEIQAFEKQWGPIPLDYRWYLLTCGGGVIGCEWIDGIKQLPETHLKFSTEKAAGYFSLQDFFPIGWDGAGNPYGFDLKSGTMIAEDHQGSGIFHEANNFFDLLCVKGLIEPDADELK